NRTLLGVRPHARRDRALGGDDRRRTPIDHASSSRPPCANRNAARVGGESHRIDSIFSRGNSYLPIADAVFRLDPFHLGPADSARVHGTNERLAISDIVQGTQFYMRLMKDLR